MARSRNFTFTYHFNDDEKWSAESLPLEREEDLLLMGPWSYLIYQIEMCPTTDRLHLQGFMTFENKVSFKQLHEWFPGMWVKKSKASALKNIQYCSKLDTRVDGPYEYGDRPCQGYRSDLAMQLEMIKNGVEPLDVVAEVPMASRNIKHMMVYSAALCKRPADFVPDVFIRWGPSGTGKTRWAYDNYRSVFSVPYKRDNIWWDGYANQACILIDDWPLETDEGLYNLLLAWTDRYNVWVPFKGGMTRLGVGAIVITSNTEPSQWWAGKGMRALERRVKSVENVM